MLPSANSQARARGSLTRKCKVLEEEGQYSSLPACVQVRQLAVATTSSYRASRGGNSGHSLSAVTRGDGRSEAVRKGRSRCELHVVADEGRSEDGRPRFVVHDCFREECNLGKARRASEANGVGVSPWQAKTASGDPRRAYGLEVSKSIDNRLEQLRSVWSWAAG